MLIMRGQGDLPLGGEVFKNTRLYELQYLPSLALTNLDLPILNDFCCFVVPSRHTYSFSRQ
jgi:hypothetical protein